MTVINGDVSVVAKRAEESPVEMMEIRDLAAAAGYTVVHSLGQVRAEHPGTYLGAGKLDELADLVRRSDATIVIIDGALTPKQTLNINEELPDGAEVIDRYRLILQIFAEQATSSNGQLQVELARLRYELPRIKENSDPQHLNISLEKGTPVDGVRNRINDLEQKLQDKPDPAAKHREQRREQGFDLVTIAGYTNAGKSTLLHRLADEMDLSGGPKHSEKDSTASIKDRLFETLETTTRRSTLQDRPVLLTDTIGFVQDLPHWLVKSFSETLSEAAAADVVVLTVDGSDPLDDCREKLRTSIEVLTEQGVDRASIVVAMNKVDTLETETRTRRLSELSSIVEPVIPISVLEGSNISTLAESIVDRLPTDTVELNMENCDEAMQHISWMYDNANVESIEYGTDTISVTLTGRPVIMKRAKSKVADV